MSTEEKIIKNKVGLLKLSEMLGSVSEACKVMGYSRDSFYRFKELHEKKAVVEIASAFGQVRVANELTRRGLFVSPRNPAGQNEPINAQERIG